ncbi:MAG TPA: sugar ABC transporter ATP-binding protein [Vicinamibacterales bacterium]|nr:sugar ABC transporter ATP-binding protein [Vicinamibacterales bacterium]
MVEVAAQFEMRGVRKAFGGTVALDGVDLAVRGGEVCALVGQNGAGKSTLMSILAGATAPDSGSMTLNGAPYAPKDPREARRAGVAMIYQELSLAPHMSVMDNIALGVEPRSHGPLGAFGVVHRDAMRQSARAALEQLGHSDISPDAIVSALSPAAQQLVEIARALAFGCRVLVLDEPTSSLAHGDVKKLFELIGRLKQQGLAIVYISHFIEEVTQVSDRFVVLRDGRNAGEGVTSQTAGGEIVNVMVGRALEDLYPRGSRNRGEPVLELDALAPARLQPVSFTLHRGEIVGIAGLLGAGRTRLLRGLFGLDAVKSGAVKLGVHRGPASPADWWQRGMGMLSEDRTAEGLATSLNIADNLTLTRLEGPARGFFVSPSAQRQSARRWMETLDIRAAGPLQQVSRLSGGNQQKVALARLLHHGVDVLVLDEPTRGIDVASKAQIYKLIDALVSGESSVVSGVSRTRQQKAVLVVSSYFPELLALCDRIAVMTRGRLGTPRPASEWTEHALVLEAAGESSSRRSAQRGGG